MSKGDTPESGLRVRPLEEPDVQPIVLAFEQTGSNAKGLAIFQRYLSEQHDGRRTVLLAFESGEFAGYLTVDWRSIYPAFRQDGIPEISDFNVLPRFRRRGIGTRLMDEAERRIVERSPVAGIGFGLYQDYRAAQRMYVQRGYVPDGEGLKKNGRDVKPGDRVRVDDDLALFLTKQLRPNGSEPASKVTSGAANNG